MELIASPAQHNGKSHLLDTNRTGAFFASNGLFSGGFWSEAWECEEEEFVPRRPLAPNTLVKEPLMLRLLFPVLPPFTSKLPVVAGLHPHLQRCDG